MLIRIKNLCYKVRCAFQRMFRGYGDDEVTNFDYNFIKRTFLILSDIHSRFDCYTASTSDDIKHLKWKLRLMKYHLIRMDDKFYLNEDGEYTLSYEDVKKQEELNKEKFFKLFNECFYNM